MDKDLLMLCITYYSGLEILLIQSSQVLGKFVILLIPDSYDRESIRYSLQIRKITEWKEYLETLSSVESNRNCNTKEALNKKE